jgi:hypothetical protein
MSERRELPIRVTNRLLSSLKGSFIKEYRNPVMSVGIGGSWDAGWVAPVIVLKVGNTFYLYYVGSNAGGRQVGLATSQDGINWTKNATNPIIPRVPGTWENETEYSSVIIEGETWKMWYLGIGADGVFRMGYATSTDGVSWTKYAGNPVLGAFGGGQCILKMDNTYVMYAGTTEGVGLWTSNDGLVWTFKKVVLHKGNAGEWDGYELSGVGSVIKVGDSYLMLYEARARPRQDERKEWNHGFAYSLDGENWIKDSRNPCLSPGTVGQWDEYSVEAPHILLTSNYLFAFYQGRGSAMPGRIGLARIALDPKILDGAPRNFWNDATAPVGGWALIINTTVPAGKRWYLKTCGGGSEHGDQPGVIRLEIEGVSKAIAAFQATGYVELNLEEVEAVSGGSVRIYIWNSGTGGTSFNAWLNLKEVDLL